ncbi:MAG: hypothetical protein FWG21_05425, partial [Oscillospiraceae bacterium]|nr:hypothetical protein [Oscillospiraceae bacterium]
AAKTLDYSLIDEKGNIFESRYRGLNVYDLFVEIGLNSNASDAIFFDGDGNTQTVSLSELRKRNFSNIVSPEKETAFPMLAFGVGIVGEDIMVGLPLVKDEKAAGFDDSFGNYGGPLKLIIPNSSFSMDNIVAVEITANDIDSWGHAMSDIYSEFLEHTLTLTIKNDDSEYVYDFTLAQIESMFEIIVRDSYTVLDIGECEGIDLYKFILRFAGDLLGMDNPISITAVASDGYMNDLLSVFFLEGMQLGIPDEDGNRKPLIIAYAVNGLPLVDNENHEGYTGMVGNMGGPLRVVAESNQGASVKYLTRLTVVLPGSDDLESYINVKRIADLEAIT